MKYIIYIISLLLVLIWALALFGFQAGVYIHVLLITAFILVIFQFINSKGKVH